MAIGDTYRLNSQVWDEGPPAPTASALTPADRLLTPAAPVAHEATVDPVRRTRPDSSARMSHVQEVGQPFDGCEPAGAKRPWPWSVC